MLAEKGHNRFPEIAWHVLDVEKDDHSALEQVVKGAAWVINCVGKTKPYTHDDNAEEIRRAITVNCLFPYELAAACEKSGAKVLSIATDCVFSGERGGYVESDKHDALDVYGKTKSLGECYLPNAYNLRCSIIGPEPKRNVFLLEWFRRQARNAQVNGFTNHRWNGVTTLQFARICSGVIKHSLALPHVQHVIPEDTISKADMLRCFAREYKRDDVRIMPVEAGTAINRVLSTENPGLNVKLWQSAGYPSPPSVPEMVAEMARFDFRMGALF
jgi:dTDP-4-dehydrorhamnose reductase